MICGITNCKNKGKTDLIDEIGISSSTLVKMRKGEVISMVVFEKTTVGMTVTCEILLTSKKRKGL